MPYERRVVVTWQTLTAFAEQSEQFSFRSHPAKRRGAKGGGTTYGTFQIPQRVGLRQF
jgi:hypothetical protein